MFPRKRIPLMVRDVMSQPPVTIDMTVSVRDAARLMCEKRIGSLLVVDKEGRLRGILTERDVLCAAGKDVMNTPVWTIMTENPVTIKPEAPIDEAIKKMVEIGIRHLPVVDKEGKPVGIISVRDILGSIRLFVELFK